jgi:hypothetical protein
MKLIFGFRKKHLVAYTVLYQSYVSIKLIRLELKIAILIRMRFYLHVFSQIENGITLAMKHFLISLKVSGSLHCPLPKSASKLRTPAPYICV